MKTRVKGIFYRKQDRFPKRRFITYILFIVLFSFISILFSSIPGTFAWFTSETEATGTIQNANTADLLTIQASEVIYEENCSLSNGLSVKNISELDTTVRIFVVTNEGEKLFKEQHLNPNETLLTSPEDLKTILANDCSTDHIEYRIRAFVNFVDEPFIVAVDPNQMKETPTNFGSEIEQDQPVQETPINVDSELKDGSDKPLEEVAQKQEQSDS
jgi:hypothetical protein